MKKLVAIGMLMVASACAPQITVYTDSDPDYDLWTYQSFNWSEKLNIEANENPIYYNELNDKRIKSAVTKEMKRRGYQLMENNGELVIHYHIVVQDQMEIITERYGYSYTPYWMHRRPQQLVPYREGSLLIDIMDPKSKNLIWRGWAVSVIERSYTPSETEELINRAVSKIFKKFPGRVKPQAITKGVDNK